MSETIRKRFISDLKKYYSYAVCNAKTLLKAEVANSYLNWIWWVLEPLCFMLIYVFIFGVVFNAREPYFPIYIFIGLTMWIFFSKSISQSVRVVKSYKAIVSKVYIPKFILILTTMLVNGYKMLISMGIIIIMLFFYRVPVGIHMLYIVPLFLEFSLLTFGCCTFLLHFGVYIEDLTNIVNIVLRLLMYLTGIFFNIETRLPAPYNRYVLHLNPVAFFISSIRKSVLENAAPSFKWMLLYAVLGTVIAVSGLLVIYRNENNYVKAI